MPAVAAVTFHRCLPRWWGSCSDGREEVDEVGEGEGDVEVEEEEIHGIHLLTLYVLSL